MFDYETEVGTVHVEKGILQEEIVQKEVEIGGLYVSNDLLEEKLEKSEKDKASFEDGLDDMVTHMVTQEYHERKTSLRKYVAISVCISVGIYLVISVGICLVISVSVSLLDKEEDKDKMQEEEQSKEGEVDQTISERVEIATGLHDEILSDEVIDKTIYQIFKDTQEGERKEEKKRKRKQDDIDPPSMVKDLKGKDDRTVKMEEGFIYYQRNQKERKKSNFAFEMTKLFNYISQEDMDLLDTIYEFEKEDKNNRRAFIWHNPVNNDTVTIEDVLNLLNEGDIGNTCIDGLTYILERQEEKTVKTHGNYFYITSTCWTLIKEKADARTNLINEKLKELDKVIDINGVAFYKYLIFPMNSMGGRKVKTPDHWTLLVYDTSKQQWMHYDSLTKPKKKKDPYLTDASIVKEYVEEQMRKLTLSKPPSFELISTPKPALFPTNTLSAPISSIDDAPQQQPGSVDCGIIVCYIIKQLEEQKPVPTYLTVENLKKFRAKLVYIFLNDKPRTWSIEEWKSNQLMHGMAT
ncbi:uncharacterized protein LOC131328475 [Rhododendron vialii]|uniref:uncharacterized protein LOC131328475 n=1 Tax=Rhododendron vialii TaxID=182163 RepID=UPI00265E97C2|nr:uncharacterized protein LOC131328475 [Rhododendron vialii]